MVKLFKLSAVGLIMNWWLVGRVVEQLIAPSTQMKLTNNQFHFSRRMSFSVSVMSVHNNNNNNNNISYNYMPFNARSVSHMTYSQSDVCKSVM